jgi:hypothetical protein
MGVLPVSAVVLAGVSRLLVAFVMFVTRLVSVHCGRFRGRSVLGVAAGGHGRRK